MNVMAPARRSLCNAQQGVDRVRCVRSRKTALTSTGKLELQIPRDRLASFDPHLIAKYWRRFPGFDDKIVSMYARGMSTR